MAIQKRNLNKNINGGIIQFICLLWAILQIYPVFWLIYSSLKPTAEIRTNVFALPKSLFLDNYDFIALTRKGINLGTYLKNSVFITLITLLILTAISLFAAYAIGKIRFKGKNVLIVILVGLLGIPVHSLMIPLYYFINRLSLLNNYFGLVLPYVAFFTPFTVLMLQTYFKNFPDEIIEAALIDGCSTIKLLFQVVFPISLGAISSVLIINFIGIWNEFLFALVIMKNNSAKTIAVGITNFVGTYSSDFGPMFAGLMMALTVPLIFYFIFHRNLIKGITAGALKG